MPLYSVQDVEAHMFVVAIDFDDAVRAWREHTVNENADAPAAVLEELAKSQPEAVHLVCDDEDLICSRMWGKFDIYPRAAAHTPVSAVAVAPTRPPCSTGWTSESNSEISLSELELSVRPLNCIEAAQIFTVEQLVTHSEWDLLRLRNFGETCLREVKQKLAARGLCLRGDKLEEAKS